MLGGLVERKSGGWLSNEVQLRNATMRLRQGSLPRTAVPHSWAMGWAGTRKEGELAAVRSEAGKSVPGESTLILQSSSQGRTKSGPMGPDSKVRVSPAASRGHVRHQSPHLPPRYGLYSITLPCFGMRPAPNQNREHACEPELAV